MRNIPSLSVFWLAHPSLDRRWHVERHPPTLKVQTFVRRRGRAFAAMATFPVAADGASLRELAAPAANRWNCLHGDGSGFTMLLNVCLYFENHIHDIYIGSSSTSSSNSSDSSIMILMQFTF